MLNNQPIMSSKHFHIERLDEGIFAVLHRQGGWAFSNSGIIDLGGRTVIFDTFLTPQAATDLRLMAEALMDRSVSAIINSHFHNDHIWGNQAFNHDTDIIATEKTRLLISTAGMDGYNWYKDNANAKLKVLEADLRGTQKQIYKPDETFWLASYQAIVAALPSLKIRLPNLTFSERLTLHGTRRSAELISFNGGHTGNDTILYLPAEGIAFMSDLLFIDRHPYLLDSTPGKIQPILKTVKGMSLGKLVPGHGQVGTTKDILKMEEYVLALEDLTLQKIQAGDPLEEVERAGIPAAFADWSCSSYFKENLRFLYHHYSDLEAL